MTPQDHNKVLGVLNLIYGGMNAFGMLIGTLYVWFILGMIKNMPPEHGGAPFPPDHLFGFLLVGITALMAVFTLAFAVPPLIAGYALLKHKAWARKAAIVAAVLSAIGFPLGTALSIYSFWFMFGQGEKFYKEGGKARVSYLRDATPAASTPYSDWNRSGTANEREGAYVPPTQPPDWRS
ncbi:MAG: hypothetical protein ABR577_06265 [Pyrinomonadaceae bacterium]